MSCPRLLLGSICILTITLGACNRKDPAKCDNAKSTIQRAIGSEEFAVARQWRDYAYKQCADPADLSTVDKQITDAEAEATRRKTEAETKARDAQQLVKLLTEWAAGHRADPTRAAVNVTCQGPEDTKERWCTRERSVGGKYQVSVRYWEETPSAHKFFTIGPAFVKCDAFGTATVIAEKQQGAQLYCDVTGGPLAGLKLLIQNATDGTRIHLASNEFLEKDPGFKALAEP
ncbi:MAG: hypothetical protein R3B13_39575 [Polyangiaceae bacterium]